MECGIAVISVTSLVGIAGITSSADAQQQMEVSSGQVIAIPEYRWTLQTRDGDFHVGDEAQGLGVAFHGPSIEGLRPWIAATYFRLSFVCFDSSDCPDDRHWVYRAGLSYDFRSLVDGGSVGPFVALAVGHTRLRSRWFLAPSAGVAIALTDVVGLRGSVSWGERPLSDARVLFDLGLSLTIY
jgi:outer membrane receptor protein involved in Fe transport